MKRTLILVSLLLLFSFVGIVSAVEQAEIEVSVREGWNLLYGLYNPSQIIGGGNFIELIYMFDPVNQQYGLLYAKQGTSQGELEQAKALIPASVNIPTSVVWVYSEQSMRIKYSAEQPLNISERKLFKGWNFVTITPEITGFSVNDIKGDCNLNEVYTFGEEDGVNQWISFKDYEGSLDNKRGLGESASQGLQLVIKVADNCQFSKFSRGKTQCTETDGGKDYYTKGHLNCPEPCYLGMYTEKLTKAGEVDTDDWCLEGIAGEVPINEKNQYIRLSEAYCDPTVPNGARVEWYDCPNGCENGACLR